MWRHQRSPKCFLQIASHKKNYNTVHGLVVFSSSRPIEWWYTYWAWGHVKVTWLEVTSSVLCCTKLQFWGEGKCVINVCSEKNLLSLDTWPENYLSKNCRSLPPVSNAVYRLSLACFAFDISGGIRPLPSVQSWPRPPSERGLTLAGRGGVGALPSLRRFFRDCSGAICDGELILVWLTPPPFKLDIINFFRSGQVNQ